MIPSSYKPINGEGPSETNQPVHRRLLGTIKAIDKAFIVSKLFYFFFYTALGALFPFFSLYYKQLWLSPSQVGILLALRPTVKLICLPLWKMITGKYSKPRAVYFISIFGWLIGYYGQTLVSPDNTSCYYTNITTVHTTINNSTSNASSFLHLASRDDLHYIQPYSKVNLDYKSFKSRKVTKRDSYSSSKYPFLSSWSQSNEYQALTSPDQNSKFQASISNKEKTFGKLLRDKNDAEKAHSKDRAKRLKRELKDKDKLFPISEDDVKKSKKGVYKTTTLSGAYIGEKSPKPAEDFRIRYNFWIIRTLAVIIVLTEIITTPTPMLADNAVIQSLTDTDSDYNRQRLYGCLGLALSAALVAVWVTKVTICPYTDTIDYTPCFYIFLIAIGATVIVSLLFNFETPERDQEDYKLFEAVKIFKSPRYGFFLFTMFVLGFAHSLQISFLFWFLQDIGGTPVLFALMILVYCISEVFMYFILGFIIKAIGAQRTLAIAIACYSARFLMYGSLKFPWLVIPMELVQGMTYCGVWTVAGMYVQAPEGATKIIQSILHGAYWGVGMALGALVSGFAVEASGAQNLFLIMSLVMAILCLTHFFIFLLDHIKGLEEEARQKRELSTSNEQKINTQREESFIGAPAAPLVPCLLYGR